MKHTYIHIIIKKVETRGNFNIFIQFPRTYFVITSRLVVELGSTYVISREISVSGEDIATLRFTNETVNLVLGYGGIGV